MESPLLKTELARSLDLSPYQTALSVVLCAHGCGLHKTKFGRLDKGSGKQKDQ
jgi:hypothetical protein